MREFHDPDCRSRLLRAPGLLLAGLAPALFGSPAAAGELDRAFVARCVEEVEYSFRHVVTVDGSLIAQDWVTGDNPEVFSAWVFEWNPTDRTLVLDGSPLPAVSDGGGNVLVAYDLGPDDFGVGLRSYALNVRLMTVVSSQVDAFADSNTNGIITRSVEFSCAFYFD